MAKQCQTYVYVRDMYRRTGRGPGGFQMHYSRRQCMRDADFVEGKHCWQHIGKYSGEETEI